MDTYLAHMLVKDSDHFARRGFFMAPDNGPLAAVLEGPAITEKSSYTMSFYVGDKEYESLVAVDTQLQDLVFSGWFSFFSKWLLMFLLFFFNYLGNFGFAIIAVTLTLKLFFMPFIYRAQRGAKIREKLKRPLAQLQAQHANDPQRAFEEQTKLLAQHGVSQTGMALGCLVSALQLPLFFTFYRVLGSIAELYQTPFVGWIIDLSTKDPYHVLPIIASVFIFNQPILPMGDNKSRTMGYVLPLVMVGLVFSIPAGVQLYMCINMGFSMLENMWRPKA
jgi:YidC/Oxa1 family membrane protein insertase